MQLGGQGMKAGTRQPADGGYCQHHQASGGATSPIFPVRDVGKRVQPSGKPSREGRPAPRQQYKFQHDTRVWVSMVHNHYNDENNGY